MAAIEAAPLTIGEFSRLHRDGERHEMSAGELITRPLAKSLHALITLAVLESLQAYFREQGLRRAIPDAGYVLSRDPLTVRLPDVSVLSTQRIQSTGPDEYFKELPN